jgi:hypothetical protein
MNPLNEKANTLARCGSFYYRTLVDESKAEAEFVSHLPGLVRVTSLGNKIAAAVQGECYYQDYHKLIKFTDSDIDWNGTKAALQARVSGGKGAITTKLEQLSVSAARILGDTDWELLPEDLPEGLKAISSIKMQVLNTSPVITPVYLQVFNIISQDGQADVISCIATSVEAVELNAGEVVEWTFNTLAINADIVSETNKILFQFATTADAAWQSATAVPSSQTVGVGAYVPSVQFWRLAAPEQSLATFNRPAQLKIEDHFFAGTDTWEYLAKEGTPQPIAMPGEGQDIVLPETQELIWDLHISKDIMVTSIRKQDGTVMYANQDFATQFGKLTFLQNPIALFPNMQFIAQSYTGRMPNLYNYLVRADEVYGPIDRMLHYTRGAQSIKSLYYASAQAAGLAVVSEDCVVVASSPLLDGLAYITTKGRYDAPYPHTPIALGTKLPKDYVIGGKQLYRLIGPYDPMPSNIAGIDLGTALPVPGLVAPNAEIEITDELGNYRPKYTGTTAAVTAYHKYLESGSYPTQEPNKKENGIQHFRYTACANRCVVACINESHMTSQMKLRLMTYLRRELPIGSVLVTANLPNAVNEFQSPIDGVEFVLGELRAGLDQLVGAGNYELSLSDDIRTLTVVFNENVDNSISVTVDNFISRVVPMNLMVECEYYLPVGYTALEYLESSGTQYLKTSIVPNASTGIEAEYELTAPDSGSRKNVIGSQSTGGQTMFILMGKGYGWNNSRVGVGLTNYARLNWKGNKLYENGSTVKELPSLNFTPRLPLFMFCLNYGGNKDEPTPQKIKWIKIDNGEKLISHFIPALDSKGVPCMYDRIAGKPLYNEGTGVFGYALNGDITQPSGIYARLINGELDVMADTEDVAAMPMTLDLNDEVTPFVHFNNVNEAMAYYNIEPEKVEHLTEEGIEQ